MSDNEFVDNAKGEIYRITLIDVFAITRAGLLGLVELIVSIIKADYSIL